MDADIELRHLRYFVAVAEELHFGRAAARLHLSQPPLSQQIRNLEETLGYALFHRTSRSVRLTTAGEAFLPRARRTLRNMQRDLEETRSIGRGEVGSLNIGFVGSAVLTTLPAIFRAYRAAYPRVHLQLHESFTSRVIEGMENGSLDAGILRDGDAVEGLQTAAIYSEPYIALLPASHRCAARKNISPAMLRDEPFVYYPRTAGTRAYEKPLSIFDEHGFRPQIAQEASHWLTIMSLIGAGFGVSIAPSCVRRIAPPQVVCLPLRGVKLMSHIELAWLAAESRPIVKAFMQIATRSQRRPHLQ
jgi:DNA-binding transcriptional LysR family regulator